MIPTSLREQIMRDEGDYQRFAYQDSEGYWTIGFGRCIDRRRGKGVSLAEAELMLDNDLRDFTADVLVAIPWSVGLDQVRREALVNMALNMGIGNSPAVGRKGTGLLGFTNFLAAMKAGDWPTAKAHMLDSKWARQVGPRAERLGDQVLTGVRQ